MRDYLMILKDVFFNKVSLILLFAHWLIIGGYLYLRGSNFHFTYEWWLFKLLIILDFPLILLSQFIVESFIQNELFSSVLLVVLISIQWALIGYIINSFLKQKKKPLIYYVNELVKLALNKISLALVFAYWILFGVTFYLRGSFANINYETESWLTKLYLLIDLPSFFLLSFTSDMRIDSDNSINSWIIITTVITIQWLFIGIIVNVLLKKIKKFIKPTQNVK